MAIQTEQPELDLTLNANAAFYILMKAREFDAQVEQTDPDAGSNPSDDRSVDILEETVENPTRQELFDAIDALNEDEKLDLLALTWLGRGGFSIQEWCQTRQMADDMADKHIARYLIETPLLSDFLEEGLAILGLDVEDVKLSHL